VTRWDPNHFYHVGLIFPNSHQYYQLWKSNIAPLQFLVHESVFPLSEDQDRGGWIILGWILERWDGVMWTRLVWLRVGTGGELLWIRYWTLGFHKMLCNYQVASQLVAS
jgi:hypothetical protein